MKQTAQRSVSDEELLEDILDGSSVSFSQLFQRYLPLIHKMGSQYYFQDVDAEDWEQEARIVLLKTVRRYSVSRGVAFGYFFKFNLQHHAFDLIRREKAAKRVQSNQRIDIDQDGCGGELVDESGCRPDDLVICHENMTAFIASCSEIERLVFSLVHAGKTPKAIAKQLNCDERRVTSAMDRCRKKMNALL